MTKIAHIGSLKIGGKNPVRIKGMLKGSLAERSILLEEARSLVAEGAEAIRIAIKRPQESSVVQYLKKYIEVPLVADIHFNYKLALEAIENSFDAIRLNPLNLTDMRQIQEVARAARLADISIRVGINSGGFRKDFSSDEALAREMSRAALNFIKILEKEDFYNITVSLKAASVKATMLANRLFAKKSNYPLHLGVTASGPFQEAVVKSAIGIGGLLEEGLGSIIRVSLTAPSYLEMRIAKFILQALGLRKFGPEIISCPTCSRCQVDLVKVVNEFQKEAQILYAAGCKLPLKIAIMGCEVNGPGEARQADIGVAFGKGRGVVFKKDKMLGSVSEKNAVREFLKIIDSRK
ncbi:MAG: (E)-4-hydroxy-3-methylbut-2-enyl-diphosphate synthase [Candidatus Omnitrophica bacterium]|nr:(E)-4-hydroxy-3-methylbut-2-enyl-diphosphate synthase [Candidatus Omnitrophota bacterium]